MNVLQADTGSFNKLLASVGLILIAVAIVAPWLFLRETSVLEIKEADLSTYTQQARDVLRERQDRVALIQAVIPWAALALFGTGALMIFFGAKGMKELQPWEAMETRARARQAEASIQPQTEQDRQESVQDDAEVAVLAEASSVPLGAGSEKAESPTESPPATTPDSKREGLRYQIDEMVRRRRELEDAVLNRLAERHWSHHSFTARVKVIGRQGGSLLLDGLLRARDGEHPDVLIEIQVVRSPRGWTAMRAILDRVLSSVHRYERATGRRATPWLIVVVEDFDPSAAIALQQQLAAQMLEGTVSVGPADHLTWLDKAGPDLTARVWLPH